ncbi:pyridoxamine 5'-phosphate oxidase [candidate division KSB3 bacterium]|uniref:Pyridoxamine 5'-phosphate oxidase n=1 Tax=candidate division KSB3 bacterium TaxID=2044937 RepID=A0A2G6K6W2_9BACT|nr:MAG: pyridoxamine 5'-phosphate oxidase [candidate division KSB3 bacterium]
MRRKDRAITALHDIEAIIRNSLVCRLGLSDSEKAYIVPMCFGYHNRTFYLHSAQKGLKLDIIRRNNQVCVECECGTEVVRGKNFCDWGMKYRSVIGFGKAVLLDDINEKKAALRIIMQQYTEADSFEFSEISLDRTCVIRVDIDQITGKMAGYDKNSSESDL